MLKALLAPLTVEETKAKTVMTWKKHAQGGLWNQTTQCKNWITALYSHLLDNSTPQNLTCKMQDHDEDQ